MPSLERFSRLFYWVLNLMRFGEHRGGMIVVTRGVEGGRNVERSWHLLAEGDDGPYIPSMAIEAIVRKLLAGTRPDDSARSGIGALDLADYDAVFEGRKIDTGFREAEAGAPLYRKILGPAFFILPQSVQNLRGGSADSRWTGLANVRRGKGLAARLVAALFGFPQAASHVPITVTFCRANDTELWVRSFGGKRFSSVQSLGTGRNEALLVERFGPTSFSLALVVKGDRLMLVPRRWSLFGIPMPHFLLPTGASFETERDGQFYFDVEIALPLIGLVVAYRGTLDPA